MENGIDRGGGSTQARSSRAWARDVLGAIALVEAAIAQRVLTDLPELAEQADLGRASSNAFGNAVTLERVDTHAGTGALLQRAGERTSAGERVTVVASARGLAGARGAMRALVAQRLGVVAHALCHADDGGNADALSLADLGWGVLFASSVGESLDLALVARRAAEDSGTPFVVVHECSRVRHVEPIAPMSRELCEVFIGAPNARVRERESEERDASTGARTFAERVPFALGSAMRELEARTGRRHDVLERAPQSGGDSAVALVGLGTVGDSLIAEVDRLRAAGHDVAAVKLVALRPFPGARLVKALSRALAITVIEGVDVPLAQSNPLTAEIKASFADALTWAPDYPGVGRMPRILSGVAGVAGHELEAHDLDAIVHNMLADERGRRTFVLGTDQIHTPVAAAPHAAAPFSMRGVVVDAETATSCADLCVAVVASALGLRARASVRPLKGDEGSGFAFDLVAGRDRPRGAHAPHAARLIALSEIAALDSANPLRRLARGGIVAIPSAHRSADGVWSEVPTWAKALIHDRGARLIGYDARKGGPAGHEARWLTAAACAGLALAGASASAAGATGATGVAGHVVDPSLVAREVGEALRAALEGSAEIGGGHDALASLTTEAGEIARRAFEAHVEVPRATVERDEEGVRLGRKDARASSPPR